MLTSPNRQNADNWFTLTVVPVAGGAFPAQVVFSSVGISDFSAVRSVQSPLRKAKGYSRIRVGVTSSVAGTLYVMQGWTENNLSGFAVTLSGATVVDTVSGLNVVDADVPVTRLFVTVRFTATADFPATGGVLEAGASLLPV